MKKYILVVCGSIFLGFLFGGDIPARIINKVNRIMCQQSNDFNSGAEKFLIKVEQENIKLIEEQLDHFNKFQKLAKNFEKGKEYWKGKVIYKDDTIKSKFRVKGRIKENYENRESFSMKIKQNDRTFSLVPLHTKSFIKEWVINQILRLEGLPYFDEKIVQVEFHENDYLAYIIPELPQTRKGILTNVAKFDNAQNFQLSADYGWFDSQNFDFVQLKFSKEWSRLTDKKDFETRLKSHTLNFKFDEIAKTVAICKLFQGHMPAHGLMLHNILFYLDKKTAKVGVVCADQNFIGTTSTKGFSNLMQDSFFRNFLLDEKFCKRLIYYLKYYSNQKVIEKWEQELGGSLTEKIEWIQNQYQCYDFSFDLIKNNTEIIKDMISNKVKILQMKNDSFMVNFGEVPQIVLVGDSSVILYPSNTINWKSFIKL
jgi:hypothetical protein